MSKTTFFSTRFTVQPDGSLTYTGQVNPGFHSFRVVIPKDLYHLHPQLVREYAVRTARNEIATLRAQERNEKRIVQQALRSIRTRIGVQHHDGTNLFGVVTFSKGLGLSVLDVTLVQPEQCAGVRTLYGSKTNSCTPLLENFKPTIEALIKAKGLLIEIYEHGLHRAEHPCAYTLLHALLKG